MSLGGEMRHDAKMMLSHLEYHDVRGWLMRGAVSEDANTIRRAIERLTDGQLNRRMARMLADEEE